MFFLHNCHDLSLLQAEVFHHKHVQNKSYNLYMSEFPASPPLSACTNFEKRYAMVYKDNPYNNLSGEGSGREQIPEESHPYTPVQFRVSVTRSSLYFSYSLGFTTISSVRRLNLSVKTF